MSHQTESSVTDGLFDVPISHRLSERAGIIAMVLLTIAQAAAITAFMLVGV